MIKFFKGKTEDTEDINSWLFEQDIKQVFMADYTKRLKKILTIIFICLAIMLLGICLYYCNLYKSILKAAAIVFCEIIIGIIVAEVLSIILSWLCKHKIVKRYWPLVIFPVTALVAIIMFVNNIQLESNSQLQRSDILGFCGDFLAFLGAFCLGYFIYAQDCEKRIEEKRSRVRLLLTQIDNANTELWRLNQLYKYKKCNQISENQIAVRPIPLDSNWLIYYLEYESLKGSNPELKRTVTAFFDNINLVNVAIGMGKMEFAVKISEQYIDRLMYSTQKYNEIEAIACLMDACDDSNFINTKTWLEQKETVELINELCRKYYFLIENYIYSWLLKHKRETTTEEDNVAREVMDWLLNNSPEIQEIIRLPDQKRIISRVVFDCSRKFSHKSKKVDYVWGEYSLK